MTWLIRLLVLWFRGLGKGFLVHIHWLDCVVLEKWHIRFLKQKVTLPHFTSKAWAYVSQLRCIRSTSVRRWRIDKASSESSCSTCTKCQRVCMRLQSCCRGAAGDGSLWWCCCCFRAVWGSELQGTKCWHSSDLTAIPEISSSRFCSSLWPMPLPYLPSSFCALYWHELICTMCSLTEKEGGKK